jgi:catechol 2,3-dioxygenase-like lactoylglutathione lyase family enzyme
MAETQPPTNNTTQHGQPRPVTITAADGSSQEINLTPNAGASIPDKQAIGEESEPLATYYKRVGIDNAQRVQMVKLAHMRYQHPDLDEITTFLRDFGMHVVKRTEDKVWYRGYGPDQYVYYAQKGEKKFLGGVYEVESEAELEKAAKIPGASAIEELVDSPGGGKIVTLHDPEGFPVSFMFGAEPAPKHDYPKKVIYNYEDDKPRVRKFNRFTPGPAAVHKLGHYGLCVKDFPAQLEWYTRNFNFAPTDFLYVPSGEGEGKTKDVAVFAHIDRGEDPVDHHTFFMSSNPTAHVHHCSFEVHDYDTQHLGHQWLAGKEYKSVWGIGRHILGSQLFDYCKFAVRSIETCLLTLTQGGTLRVT